MSSNLSRESCVMAKDVLGPNHTKIEGRVPSATDFQVVVEAPYPGGCHCAVTQQIFIFKIFEPDVRHRQFSFLGTLHQREHANRYSCLLGNGHINILVLQSFL